MPDDRAKLPIKRNALFAIGVVGSALMIFQALEPFLKLSRLAVWIVEHWRGIVVAPWVWLGELVHIHIPTEVTSAITLCIFVATFAVRASPSRKDESARELSSNDENVNSEIKSLAIVFRALLFPIFLSVSAFVIVKPTSFFGFLLTLSVSTCTASWIALGSTKDTWIEFIVFFVLVFGPLSFLFVLDNLLLDYWIHYYILFLFVSMAFMALSFPVLAYGEDIYQAAKFSAAGARQAVQATLLVIALVCMNWIGLYAQALKGWLDNITALSP